MSFDPKKLLKTAVHLDSLDNDEETIRSKVNRAYYAAFGVAKIKTHITSYEDTHTKVIRALENSENPSHQKAGKGLESLRKSRRMADYDYNKTLYASAYSNVINDAKNVIEELEKELLKTRP
jgi:hypothetical protein